jgi:tRNA nucleotidyltransferase (CCA-adding enzyme)
MGLVGDLSSSRLRDELTTLLEDAGAAQGIRRLGELGADRAIHPHLRGDDSAAALFSRAAALRDELEVDLPTWRIGIAALARELTSDEAYGWLERLAVRRRDADRIVGAIAVAPRIVERLRSETLDPAQVVALADPFAPDAPLFALALEDRAELRDYFDRLRAVRLEIGGADLIALGLPESPRIGEILGEIRKRKLNGELDGREAELAAARGLVEENVPA